MDITKDTIERFSKKIRYNVETFLDLYSVFIDYHQPTIQKYFQVPDQTPDADSFTFLDDLISRATTINDLIKINRQRFDRLDDWDMLDFFEDVRMSLDTIAQTSKYARSSKAKNSWMTTGIIYNHTLGQNETLENVATTQLLSTDKDNEWVNLALANNIFESDYGLDGGINVQIQNGVTYKPNMYLRSVIDTLVGESLYGIDLSKKITFQDDDVLQLSYKNTFLQSVGILILISKGDIPEFPLLGRDASISIGSNISAFDYQQLIRQMQDVFNTDDTIAGFNIVDFKYDSTDMYIEYQVNSFYNINYSALTKL